MADQGRQPTRAQAQSPRLPGHAHGERHGCVNIRFHGRPRSPTNSCAGSIASATRSRSRRTTRLREYPFSWQTKVANPLVRRLNLLGYQDTLTETDTAA